ncbi:MAG TPA: alginate lyase family protein, partial [Gemmataceae bacterium]
WYDADLTAFAVFLGDRDLARQVVETAKAKRVARQIEPNGSMPKELDRTKSLDYTLFNLQALSHLATLGDRVGVDLWRYRTPDGRGMRKALDYVVSYTTDDRPWPGEQITDPHLANLRTLLRRAAAAYGARSYLDVLPKLADHPDAPLDLLLYPPPG